MNKDNFPVMLNAANLAHEETSLETLIQSSLSERLNIPRNNIIIPKNKEKYHDALNPTRTNPLLQEVFDIMRRLNETALHDFTLGCDQDGNNSFANCIDNVARDIADIFENKNITYLELGPEPAKTRRIISKLQNLHCTISDYISVDINPSSEVVMRNELSDLLSYDHIHCITKPFDKLTTRDIRIGTQPTLATMLGFQEGNEHPDSANYFLSKILQHEDFLLSEMQIFTGENHSILEKFYLDPRMRRFSRLALERIYPDAQSRYRFEIIPVTLENGQVIRCCVSCEDIFYPNNLEKYVFVANYCLKYTLAQFRNFRINDDLFKIICEHSTGDNTVSFQLSRRTNRTL
ncbi:L-histidine N(alpha)-methyltransferase [Ferruginivarius sediminum]|uniref:L-histidine N(alpha)-methyltransferase n=1 Tax=Ferruginivarius sediminum TaxID=2661937 RepID=UPI0011C04305|nr:L-histidine N(alpha)-methyltransferase [Ferruginivarius sediminum]